MERLNAVLPIRDIFSRVILNCCGQSALETDVLAGEDVERRDLWSALKRLLTHWIALFAT